VRKASCGIYLIRRPTVDATAHYKESRTLNCSRVAPAWKRADSPKKQSLG